GRSAMRALLGEGGLQLGDAGLHIGDGRPAEQALVLAGRLLDDLGHLGLGLERLVLDDLLGLRDQRGLVGDHLFGVGLGDRDGEILVAGEAGEDLLVGRRADFGGRGERLVRAGVLGPGGGRRRDGKEESRERGAAYWTRRLGVRY